MILHLLGTKCPSIVPCSAFPQPTLSRGTAADSDGSSILYTLIIPYGNRENQNIQLNCSLPGWPFRGRSLSFFIPLVRLFLVGYSCSFKVQQSVYQTPRLVWSRDGEEETNKPMALRFRKNGYFVASPLLWAEETVHGQLFFEWINVTNSEYISRSKTGMNTASLPGWV